MFKRLIVKWRIFRKNGVTKNIFREMLKHYPYLIISALLVLIMSAVTLVLPRLLGKIVDEGIQKKDAKILLHLLSFYIVLEILRYIVGVLSKYSLTFLGQRVMQSIRNKIYSHVVSLPISFFDRTKTGKIVTRVTNDVVSLGEFFSAGFISIISDLAVIFGVFAFLIPMNLKLGLIILSFFPLIVYSSYNFGNKYRKVNKRVRDKISKVNSFIAESISGIKIIQTFAVENKMKNKFETVNQEHLTARLATMRLNSFFQPVMTIYSGFMIAVVLVVGGLDVIDGKINIGLLIACLGYVQAIQQPMRNITEYFNTFQSAMASADKIYQILGIEIEHFHSLKNEKYPFEGKIEFKEVCFSYNGKIPVLKNVSFTINPSESFAIVGPTGAGKTTILSLLMRYYDIQSGEILIDGVNINTLDKMRLRASLGFVQQDVFLFSDTIHNNISLNDKRISAEMSKKAAEETYASNFIERLEKGYETEIQEKGLNLSLGERQLLSFARALAFDPKIIMLDEATSSIDIKSEELLQKATKKSLSGRTSIIIAHRINTIVNADKILVIESGKVSQLGRHKELMNQDGFYKKLIDESLKSEHEKIKNEVLKYEV